MSAIVASFIVTKSMSGKDGFESIIPTANADTPPPPPGEGGGGGGGLQTPTGSCGCGNAGPSCGADSAY